MFAGKFFRLPPIVNLSPFPETYFTGNKVQMHLMHLLRLLGPFHRRRLCRAGLGTLRSAGWKTCHTPLAAGVGVAIILCIMEQKKMDKIVVLARGLGTRMRRDDAAAKVDGRQAAVAVAGIKALIPIDRPFLDYVLSAAADAGYRHACLVIGPEQEAIREYYQGQVAAERLDFAFACQPEPRGTADAVAAAESFAGDDPFVVINSDNYYPVEALRALREQSGNAVALFERDAMLRGNVPEERISRFSVGKIDAEGNLDDILEKPDEVTLASLPRPLWVSMNCWRFGPSIFEACRAIKPSARGEFEIPDAVQYVMNDLGEEFAAVMVRQPVLDMTCRGDIASVAAILVGTRVSL